MSIQSLDNFLLSLVLQAFCDAAFENDKALPPLKLVCRRWQVVVAELQRTLNQRTVHVSDLDTALNLASAADILTVPLHRVRRLEVALPQPQDAQTWSRILLQVPGLLGLTVSDAECGVESNLPAALDVASRLCPRLKWLTLTRPIDGWCDEEDLDGVRNAFSDEELENALRRWHTSTGGLTYFNAGRGTLGTRGLLAILDFCPALTNHGDSWPAGFDTIETAKQYDEFVDPFNEHLVFTTEELRRILQTYGRYWDVFNFAEWKVIDDEFLSAFEGIQLPNVKMLRIGTKDELEDEEDGCQYSAAAFDAFLDSLPNVLIFDANIGYEFWEHQPHKDLFESPFAERLSIKLPGLLRLKIGGVNPHDTKDDLPFTDDDIGFLAAMPCLRSIALARLPKVSAKALLQLSKSPPSFAAPYLRTVNIGSADSRVPLQTIHGLLNLLANPLNTFEAPMYLKMFVARREEESITENLIKKVEATHIVNRIPNPWDSAAVKEEKEGAVLCLQQPTDRNEFFLMRTTQLPPDSWPSRYWSFEHELEIAKSSTLSEEGNERGR
ncbi:hypothetical protein HDU86_005205 [Geranomyces michiganensis]|nr:hypothetical protein HDU86_005205 [Geranomyces michiganensis]